MLKHFAINQVKINHKRISCFIIPHIFYLYLFVSNTKPLGKTSRPITLQCHWLSRWDHHTSNHSYPYPLHSFNNEEQVSLQHESLTTQHIANLNTIKKRIFIKNVLQGNKQFHVGMVNNLQLNRRQQTKA